MRAIKLMPDYSCFPLWEASPDAVGNIDPDTLPISRTLKEHLTAWAEQYDSTLNFNDPLRSGFSNPDDQRKFEDEGRKLRDMLRQELGNKYSVEIQI